MKRWLKAMKNFLTEAFYYTNAICLYAKTRHKVLM